MKHSLSTTALLLFLFTAAQIVGLSLVSLSQEVVQTPTGPHVMFGPTVLGERPQTTGGESLALIAVGVAAGTALALLLVRLRASFLWRLWFLIAVWIALSIALGVLMPALYALAIATALALCKTYWSGPIIHNLTEILVYGGIAVLVAPLFTVGWAIALLILISIYDWIAVNRTGHMVTLAKAQADLQVFAGLHLPARGETGKRLAPVKAAKKSQEKASSALPPELWRRAPTPKPSRDLGRGAAVLGGGDIAFPLLFASVVQVWLIETGGFSPLAALAASSLVPLGALVALAALFAYAKKGRFYPAMPPVTLGCLAGFGLIYLIR